MKVDGLSIGLLLSMEDFGYQSLIQEMLPDLPLETADEGYSDKLKSAVEDYRTAYRAFDDAVETSGTTSPAVIAARHDKARDNAWRTLRAYVKVCTRHPDPDVAATSTRALQLIRNIGDLSIRNRTDETGRLNTLIQSLREIGAAPLAQAGITPFIDDLDRKDHAYREAYQHWIDVKGDRTIGLVQLKRRAADTAFALIHDTDHHVRVFLDKNLLQSSHLSFHPCINTASLTLPLDGFIRFMDHTGNAYEWIDLYPDEPQQTDSK